MGDGQTNLRRNHRAVLVSTVTIRRGTVADADQISELVHEVVPTLGYGADEAVAWFLRDEYSPDVVRAGIEDGSHRWLVAVNTDVEESSAPVCGAIYLNASERYFGGAHVRERRQGTGRVLMDAMVAEADELGIETLHGSVLGTNTAMLALTARYGFQITGEDPDKVYFPAAPFMIITRDLR